MDEDEDLEMDMEMEMSTASSTLPARYAHACERHGVLPHHSICLAIAKMRLHPSASELELVVDQLVDEDVAPIVDLLAAAAGSEELTAVDVSYNTEQPSCLDGIVFMHLLRAAGSKLRTVGLRNSAFSREALRDLFQGGILSTSLDMSVSRVRNMDMTGNFPLLHTLTLDYTFPITHLPEGCFKGMPHLARLSMCGTDIANLWTTCAALVKLPRLVELRFQKKCLCCQGTGQCRSQNKMRHHMDWLPTLDNLGLLEVQSSRFPATEDEDGISMFFDHDFALPPRQAHADSGDTSAAPADDSAFMDVGFGEQESSEDLLEPDLDELSGTMSASSHASTEPSDDIDRMDFGRSEGVGSSGDEGEEPSMPSRGGTSFGLRVIHTSPICFQKHYREFMVANLKGLKVLDNVYIYEKERDHAQQVCSDRFERMANNRREDENVLEILRHREMGSGATLRRSGAVRRTRSSVGFSRSLCAAKMASCSWPSTTPICRFKKSNFDINRRCRARQFEYHPTEPSYMVFGTLHGEVVVVNHESDKVVGYVPSIGQHSILGLCWLNKDPSKLIAGSDNGSLRLYDVNHMHRTIVLPGRSDSRLSTRGGSSLWSAHSGVTSRTRRSPTIYTYDNFEQLTSVHINCTDDYFLASGYSKHVGLYDLRTGKRLQIFSDLHQEHINVVKFAHHSPHLFATSSFDRDIKMWDIRQKAVKPIYTVQSTKGNVMVCFSTDDHYLLSSAVDNEVRQHLSVDGRLHMMFDIAPTGRTQNYTRSYYMNGRDYIITGSCEENVVRVCCAQTGRRLRDVALEGRGLKNSLYVQSLRGDPFKAFHFCVLVAYNLPHSRSEIVKVNLLSSEGHKRGSQAEPQYTSLASMGA